VSKIKLKESYIFIPLLIAYCILGVLYPFLAMDIAKFLLFQLLFLLLPAYVFSQWLISENLNKVERLILGYPVSMVLIFILSWTGEIFKIKYLAGLILIFSIITIYKMYREGHTKITLNQGSYIFLPVFVYIICILAALRMFIVPSSPSTPDYPGLFYPDSMYHIGLIWSYIRGLPLEHSSFSGVLVGYHIIKNIYQANIFYFTGIDPFNIHFLLGPVFDWFMAVFIIFYGGIRIAKFSLRKIAILYAGLFFTSSFLRPGFQSTLVSCPLSFYFGLPAFILFIYYIISYLNKERKLDLIYLTVLFIYFTGTKAVLGITVSITLAILFAFNFYKNGFSRQQALLLLGMFLGAILLKFTMFENTLYTLSYNYDTSKSLAYRLFQQTYFIKNYADIIYPVYRFFSTFFRLLPQFILNWQILVFLTLVFTNKEFRQRLRKINNFLIFIFIFFIVCITLGSLVEYPGARMYTFWYPQVVFLFLGIYALDYILETDNFNYKVISFFLLIIGFIFYCGDLNFNIKHGWSELPRIKKRIWDERASVDFGEWSAIQWLKKNSDMSQKFFTDRRYFAHEVTKAEVPRFYVYSALSGRQAFAEAECDFQAHPGKFKAIISQRWSLINRFLSSPDLSEQKNLLKDIKVDYFIQSLRFNNKDFSKIDTLRLVYKNESVKIFKVLK